MPAGPNSPRQTCEEKNGEYSWEKSPQRNRKSIGRCECHIYTLGVQRLLIQWSFRKDHCFTRDLHQQFQGTIILMVFDLQGNRIHHIIYTWNSVNVLDFWGLQFSISEKSQSPFSKAGGRFSTSGSSTSLVYKHVHVSTRVFGTLSI